MPSAGYSSTTRATGVARPTPKRLGGPKPSWMGLPHPVSQDVSFCNHPLVVVHANFQGVGGPAPKTVSEPGPGVLTSFNCLRRAPPPRAKQASMDVQFVNAPVAGPTLPSASNKVQGATLVPQLTHSQVEAQ